MDVLFDALDGILIKSIVTRISMKSQYQDIRGCKHGL